jgi:hypothetical protein
LKRIDDNPGDPADPTAVVKAPTRSREVRSSALNIELVKADIDRAWFSQLTQPQGREYYFQGANYLGHGTREGFRVAREMFEQLYRVQPDSVIGPSNVSLTHWLDVAAGWSDDSDESLLQAGRWAEIAMGYERNDRFGHSIFGYLQVKARNFEVALDACRRGARMRPGCPISVGLLAMVENYCGDSGTASNNPTKIPVNCRKWSRRYRQPDLHSHRCFFVGVDGTQARYRRG